MKLFKNIPLIPSIRQKCSVDKKGFLNDVYTKGTREKKLQLDAPQSGRSMIEMLGVLAIIGVLSIGGIAGYSKAMFKYKFNKTMDIITTAIHRIIELENSNMGNRYIETAQDLRDFGIVPNCDVNYTDSLWGEKGKACQLPLGEFHSYIGFEKARPFNSFSILFLQNTYESCVAFFNSKIYETVPDHWWYPVGHINIGGRYTYSKSEHVEGAKDNLNTEDIIEICSPCKNEDTCLIDWQIRDV